MSEYYKASYEYKDRKVERVIKTSAALKLTEEFKELLKNDFFMGTEETGAIEQITLKKINEKTYNEIKSKKQIVGLLLSDEKGYLEVEKREVL